MNPPRTTLPPVPTPEDWRFVEPERLTGLEGARVLHQGLLEVEGLLGHLARESAQHIAKTNRALESIRRALEHVEEAIGGLARDVGGIASKIEGVQRQASNADLTAQAAQGLAMTWNANTQAELEHWRGLSRREKELEIERGKVANTETEVKNAAAKLAIERRMGTTKLAFAILVPVATIILAILAKLF